MSKLLLEGHSLKDDVEALTKRVERLETKLSRLVTQLESYAGRQGGARPFASDACSEQDEESDDIPCAVS